MKDLDKEFQEYLKKDKKAILNQTIFFAIASVVVFTVGYLSCLWRVL